MDTYIVTAKTVEEAYAIANAKYADDKHEVSCEVIEMPKKGFLGIGARDAKIKVTVTSAVSSDLGSIVADVRGMKKFTDRGDAQKNEKKPEKQQQKPEKQNNNQQQNNQPKNRDNRDGRDNRKGGENKGESRQQQNSSRGNNNNGQQKQKQPMNNQQKSDRPQNQQNNQPKAEAKQAQTEQEQPKKQKSALHNGGRPNVRQQIKHIDGDVAGSAVTVGTPMGLTDFVADTKTNTFGSGSRSGGSMSNDIRRKKPAKPMMPADKADEKMRASKYDVAESDDDYKNIETMVRENEAKLEKEAGAALGFVDNAAETEAVELSAPEARKKEPITQAEMDYALEFANTLLKNMNVDAKAVPCECPEDEEFEVTAEANVYPKIEIVGDDTGILIGHHGETLDAIQYLVNLSALRKTKSKDGDYVKIVVDTENYRDKRADTLKSLARRMAAKAVKYKRNVFLEPMNAYERRIIHSELQSYPDVSTHSVGTDRDRKIIITYEGADKQPDNRNRRRRRGGSGRGPKNDKPAISAESAANIEEYTANAEPKRPKKIQKVSIDQIGDVLDGKNFLDGGSDN